jgi:NADH-quinone oxidoreductase subunit E
VGSWRTRFEQAPVKEPDTAAATASGPNDPKPAKPDAGRAEQKPVADTPAQRAQDGKGPAKAEAPKPGPADKNDIAVAPAAPSQVPPAQPEASGHSGAVPPPEAEAAPVDDSAKPKLLTSPVGGKGDDLKQIWGIGPKLEELLHGLGVYHFVQIEAWTPDNLRWVDQHMESFKGRAARDRWIEQARILVRGGTPAEAEAAARAPKEA